MHSTVTLAFVLVLFRIKFRIAYASYIPGLLHRSSIQPAVSQITIIPRPLSRFARNLPIHGNLKVRQIGIDGCPLGDILCASGGCCPYYLICPVEGDICGIGEPQQPTEPLSPTVSSTPLPAPPPQTVSTPPPTISTPPQTISTPQNTPPPTPYTPPPTPNPPPPTSYTPPPTTYAPTPPTPNPPPPTSYTPPPTTYAPTPPPPPPPPPSTQSNPPLPLSTAFTSSQLSITTSPSFAQSTGAPRNKLTLTSVASCGQTGINVQRFGLTYYRSNGMLQYEFVGFATTPDIFPNVLVDVTAYGRKAPTQTIQLCGIVNCPLSQNSVQGAGSLILSESFANFLPGVAWSMPDLQATATLTFNNATQKLGCLSAIMSNGITTQTTSVPWVTGGITIGVILVSGMISIAKALRSATSATASGGAVSGYAPSALSSGAAPQVHPTSPWADSNVPAQMSPMATHSPLPPGDSVLAHPGSGEAFALGAADTVLAGGGATAATPAVNGGGHSTAQPHDHDETTAPSSTHGPFAHMDPIVLFLHFQSISSSGLLSLKYAPIYQSFTINFAWANFILPIGILKRAASHFRHCTLPVAQSDHSGSGLSSLAAPPVSYGPVNQMGINAYATRLGIPSQDIFGLIYLVYLCACGALLVIFLVFGLILQIVVWVSSHQRKDIWRVRRFRWAEMASNNSLRIMVLALGTLATFSFYHWTQHCATGLAFFLSASALAIILLQLGVVCFLILHIGNRPGGIALLFSDKTSYGRRWGTLYNSLNETRLFFVVPLLCVVLARSAIIGFGQGHGLAQVVALVVLEAMTAVGLFYWRPYYSKGYNLVNYLLQTTKVISHTLLIVFVPSFNFNVMGATVIGIVLLVLNSIAALILVALTVLKIGWGVLWYRSKHHGFESRKDKDERQSTVPSGRWSDGTIEDEPTQPQFNPFIHES